MFTRSVLVHLDFKQNQIKNVRLQLQQANVIPSSVKEGQIWYDLGKHLVYFYDGSQAIPVGYLSPATSSVLGGVKIGENVQVISDGTISILNATQSQKGVIRIATNNEAEEGVEVNVAINPTQLKNAINTALSSALVYRGTWAINSTSTTTYPNTMLPAKKGDLYLVTGTGPSIVDGIEWNPGDYLIFNQDVTVGSTIVSSMVDKVDSTEASDIVRLDSVQTLTNKTINADNNTISELETDNFKSGVIVTGISSEEASNTKLPTEQAVKTYVDNGLDDKANVADLALVATTGSYDDLSDKPNIPATTNIVARNVTDALTSGGAYDNLVSAVTQSGNADRFSVTKAGDTSTITINNVANATTASKLGSTTIGSTTRPIYLNNGTPTQISYTISKSVPSNAVFTDTTYDVFKGATSTTAGASGLVKKPDAGDQNKFLKGNGDWAVVDSFPSQSGNDGKFLTTDGKFVSWADVPNEIPSQSGNSGKFLTTNGSAVSWAEVDALPSQSGNTNKYLKTDGTNASWNSLSTVAESGSYADLSNKPSFNGIVLDNNVSKSFYGTSNSAADATQKEVTISSITTLDIGQVIIIQPTITSTVANSTLKLNEFDPYPMKYNNAAITTSTDSIVWNASFPSTWLFDGTNWVFLAHGLDSNSTYTLNYSVDAGNYVSGTGSYAISRYSLVMQKPDGTWEKITSTTSTYSTGTTKTVNTSGFLTDQIKYYNTTTNLANGAKASSNVMYSKAASVDMRYSTNCSATTNWATGDYIYLVGTIGVDDLFYLDTTTWWTKTLPSTNDGKVYIRLGYALTASSYTMSLLEYHPIFYHDGTKICEYKKADNKQDKLISGTNLKTINSNSLLGSGDIVIDSLPSQTGNANKFLTTDGTNASWIAIEEYTTAEVTALWNSVTPSV